MRVESIKWKTTNTKSTCFHCIDSNVLSGSKWWIHVWFSVTKWQQNFSLSLVGLYKSRRSWHEATHWCRLCTLRFWGTQRDDTFDIWRCYWTMFSILPAKTCNSSAISDTLTFWFVIISFSAVATDSGFTASEDDQTGSHLPETDGHVRIHWTILLLYSN